MKVKVLVSFVDKKNKVTQPVGALIDMSKARFEEIMALNENMVEIVQETEGSQQNNDPE